MNKSRKGFTLAEVLVTLAIIGVVAALTIPTLISSTNSSKFTSAMKKGLANMNSVIQRNIADTGTDASSASITSGPTLAQFFLNADPLSTSTTSTNYSVLKYDRTNALGVAGNAGDTVYLADGSRITFVKNGATAGCASFSPDAFNPAANPACYAIFDTNGDKAPNTIANGSVASDVWIFGIGPSSVSPVKTATSSTVSLATWKDVNNSTTPWSAVGTIGIGNNGSYYAMTSGT